jgi:hypothetical protein
MACRVAVSKMQKPKQSVMVQIQMKLVIPKPVSPKSLYQASQEFAVSVVAQIVRVDDTEP